MGNTANVLAGDTVLASQQNDILDDTVDKGADIVAAATLILGSDGHYFNVTGNTGITAISSKTAGREKVLHFTGTPLITHNATSLILQGSVNLQIAAGDVVRFISDNGTNWRESGRRLAAVPASGSITRLGGTATEATTTSTSAIDFLTVSALTIGATTPYLFIVSGKILPQGAGGAGLGLKVVGDTTVVVAEASTSVTAVMRFSTFNNIYTTGVAFAHVGQHTANLHYMGGTGVMTTADSDGLNRLSEAINLQTQLVDWPTGNTTSLVIRGIAGSNTVGADEFHIYDMAVA